MLNIQIVMKAADAVVFLSLLLLALKYYALSPNVFDVITIVAMIYVMLRNRDINTVSLITIMALAKIIDAVIFYDYQLINPYLFYALVAIINFSLVRLVHVRFLLLYRYGPSFIRNHRGLTFTHQDAMLGWVYSAAAALPTLALIEHSIRHFNLLGFEPMFFYTLYKPVQLLLAIIMIVVLYLMTYPKSAEAKEKRAKSSMDA